MGRPKREGSDKPVHLGFRGEPELMQRIDAYAEHLSKRADGVAISRSGALRVMIEQSLERFEKDGGSE